MLHSTYNHDVMERITGKLGENGKRESWPDARARSSARLNDTDNKPTKKQTDKTHRNDTPAETSRKLRIDGKVVEKAMHRFKPTETLNRHEKTVTLPKNDGKTFDTLRQGDMEAETLRQDSNKTDKVRHVDLTIEKQRHDSTPIKQPGQSLTPAKSRQDGLATDKPRHDGVTTGRTLLNTVPTTGKLEAAGKSSNDSISEKSRINTTFTRHTNPAPVKQRQDGIPTDTRHKVSSSSDKPFDVSVLPEKVGQIADPTDRSRQTAFSTAAKPSGVISTVIRRHDGISSDEFVNKPLKVQVVRMNLESGADANRIWEL